VITFTNPADAAKFTVGQRVWLVRPKWWQRVLMFLRLPFRARGRVQVVATDHRTGTITVK
jgi:hypothetical protein